MGGLWVGGWSLGRGWGCGNGDGVMEMGMEMDMGSVPPAVPGAALLFSPTPQPPNAARSAGCLLRCVTPCRAASSCSATRPAPTCTRRAAAATRRSCWSAAPSCCTWRGGRRRWGRRGRGVAEMFGKRGGKRVRGRGCRNERMKRGAIWCHHAAGRERPDSGADLPSPCVLPSTTTTNTTTTNNNNNTAPAAGQCVGCGAADAARRGAAVRHHRPALRGAAGGAVLGGLRGGGEGLGGGAHRRAGAGPAGAAGMGWDGVGWDGRTGWASCGCRA